MEKEQLLQLALDILKDVKVSDTESVEVAVNDYDDGSKRISIEVDFPAVKER